MAKAANIFFIITVVNVVFTMAFPTNIHEMMTPEEIYLTFGTNDVPEYQVLPMTLPGARRRRQADDEIHLKVEINGTVINLNLKPTDGYLATRYTPVWLAVTDPEAYNNIRYDPLPDAMADIGEFKMYQDVDNEAAIVVYTDPDQDSIIEGIVTSDYAIKSLPKRLSDKTLKVGDNYFVDTPLIEVKRSIEPDADEITGYYVLFKTPPSSKDAKRSVPIDLAYNHREKRQRSRGGKRKSPEVVYPEILLILDHNAIRSHSITQALRFMLAFWNGVDMVYSPLSNPKIQFNIAGIIISADDAATPYIDKDTSIKIRENSYDILRHLGIYFAKEQDRFPLKQYDMILAMTTIHMCAAETDPCEVILGYAHLSAACSPDAEVKRMRRIKSVGIFYYNFMFGGVDTAVHESAHLFGVDHDEGHGLTADCDYKEGFAMSAAAQYAHQSFKWSSCSIAFFRQYFSSKNSVCLDNQPIWTKPVKKVLPGRWLTLDGQCRNTGFKKACQVPDFPICMIKGCEAEGSNECIISEKIPLPGTKCGENEYCELGTGCVSE